MLSSSAEKNFQKALDCFKNKEIEKAEELCELILKKHPNHGNTLNLFGVIIWKHGKPGKAIEFIQKAIEHHPEKAPIFCCNLALVYTHMGKVLEAANSYQKASSLFYEKEEFDEALNALLNGAYLLRDHHLWKESKSFYQNILQMNPFHVDACNDYGLILQQEKNEEGAIGYFKKALNIDPKYVPAYLNLGALFQMQKKSKEAATLFEKSLELDSECFEAHLNLATIYLEEGKFEEALKHNQKALELQPEHAGLYNNLGILYFHQGNHAQAQFYFKKALEFDPGYEQAKKNLAATLEEV